MAPLTWDELKASMGPTVDGECFKKTVEYLKVTAIGLVNVNCAVGLTNADIDRFEGFDAQPPPIKAMVRKLIRTANLTPGAGAHIPSAHSVGVPPPGVGTGSQIQPVGPTPVQTMSPMMQEMIGTTASASMAALALRASTAAVNPSEMLKRDLKTPLKELTVENQTEMSLFQLLESAHVAAAGEGRAGKVFTRVDLTSTAVRPDWMPPETVGGKVTLPGEEWNFDDNASAGTLRQLGQALRGSSETRKVFMNLEDWSICYWRHIPVALVTRNMTVASAIQHYLTVMFVARQGEMEGHSPLLGVMYSDLMMARWAQQSERRDPTLDVSEECAKVNKRVLMAAKQRMQAYDELVRSLRGGPGPQPYRGQDSGGRSDAMAESALAKQAAAADALTNKAKGATKELQNAQQRFEEQQKKMMETTPDRKRPTLTLTPNKTSEAKPLSNKKVKSLAFFDKVKAARRANMK